MSHRISRADAPVAADPPQSGRRTSFRAHVSIPVLCEPVQGETFAGTMADIGFGGACVDCVQVPQFGAALSIAVRLPGAVDLSHLPAVVRWTTSQSFGAQFGLLGARDTKLIADLIAQVVRVPQ
jgi:hypothetical protein